ncbi:uncharacterized protein LOC142984007 [Anticarsia gemmatalis]|uniref:uncharacterized protein LOC142984007 n=1 Tax=Anticarsia gemmatalis TaxID=129554 RepID=UPI003F7635A8
MKLLVLTAIIAAVASGPVTEEQKWPWQVGKVYTYDVNTVTWTKFEEGTTNGNAFQAQFIVRVESSGLLLAKLNNPEYAAVKSKIANNKETPSDLKFQPLKDLDQVFEIFIEGGRVVSLNFPTSFSVVNENLLKALVSAIQVDVSAFGHVHEYPNSFDKESFQGLFKKVEADVTGECETLYSVSPLSAEWRRELPEFVAEQDPIEIVKSKNYGSCSKRVVHQFGVPEGAVWKGIAEDNDEKQFIKHTSEARIVAGKQGTIYKSEVVSSVSASPLLVGKQKVEVYSYVSFYLKSAVEDSAKWQKAKEYRSVKSLLFSMDNSYTFFTLGAEQNIAKAQQILQEITPFLQNPNKLPQSQFLTKFNVLIYVIAALNAEQLKTLTSSIDIAKNSKNVAKAGMWTIYRDAVAQAGSTAAFEEIKSWVENKKIEGEEAAEVVTAIGASLVNPSHSVLNEFFKFATSDVVIQQKSLNNSALLAVSRLYSYADDDQFVLETVIPHFAKELKHAIQNGESSKAQVYVKVLGNLAHPAILNVFAPYLEGSVKVSTYLRTQMVTVLKPLASYRKNDQVRAVLYSILRNTAEPYEVRVAAALNIFMAFPTAEMMQVLAHMTHDDPSTQVRAVLANTIVFAAGLKDPRFAELAKTAKSVLDIINKEKFGYRYSTSSIIDGYSGDDEFSFFRELSFIGSENNILPKYQRSALRFKGTGFTEENQVILSFSDVQDVVNYIVQLVYEPSNVETDFKFSAQKIIELLNIKREARQPFEGALYIDNLNQQKLFTFSEQEFFAFIYNTVKNVENILEGVEFHYTKLLNMKNVQVAFPLASGMPFAFTYTEPALFSANTLVKFSLDKSKFPAGSLDTELDLLYARELSGAAGFVDTLNGDFAFAGVDQKLQLHLPIKINTEFSSAGGKFAITPLNADKDTNLIHWSVLPFTGVQKRDSINYDYEIIKREDKTIGADFKVGYWTEMFYQFSLDSYSSDFTDPEKVFGDEDDLLKVIGTALYQKDIAYSVFNFKYLAKESTAKTATVTLNLDARYNQKSNAEFGPATLTKHIEPNSEARREELAEKASAGIDSAEIQLVDLSVQFNGPKKVEWVFTSAVAYSYVDPKYQVALFARGSEQVNAVFRLKTPKIVPLNFEEALKNDIKVTYELDIKHENDLNVNIKGTGERSEDYTETLKQDPKVKECLDDISKNNLYQKECYKLVIKAHAPDYFKASLTYKDSGSTFWNYTNYYYKFLKDVYDWEVETNPMQVAQDGKVEIEAKFQYYEPSIMYRFLTKYGSVRVENVEGMWYYPYAMAVYGPIGSWERSRNWFTGYQNLPYCAVDTNKVWTFSGRSYDYGLSGSWHVVMVDEANNFGKYDDLVILARRPSENKEEVYVSYKAATGNYFELFIKPDNVEVKSNAPKVADGALKMYWDGADEIPLLQYYSLADGVQVFNIRDDGIRIVYDKQRLIIWTNGHRSTTRGICGQSSSQTRDDYVTPFGLVDLPEHYGAAFSLEGEFSDPKTVALKNDAKLKAYQPVTKFTSIFRNDAEWVKANNKSVKSLVTEIKNLNAQMINDIVSLGYMTLKTCILPAYLKLVSRKMWIIILTAVFATVSSELQSNVQEWPWHVGSVYNYDVDSYTLTKFEQSVSNGNAFKAQFIVRVKAPGQLIAKLENPLYAQVQSQTKYLPSDLKYQPVENIDTPFEILIDGGRILSFNLPSHALPYENLIKGLISALQVDLSSFGNVNHFPHYFDKQDFQGLFKKMEVDVTGECETLYSVSPMTAEWRRELPKFTTEQDPIEIIKSKDYGSCNKRATYQFGVPESAMWNTNNNGEEQFIKHISESRILVGKQGTIYKSEVMSSVFVNPLMFGKQKSEVYSVVKFNLNSVEQDTATEWHVSEKTTPITSLLYTMGKFTFFAQNSEQLVADAQKVLQEITPMLQNTNDMPKTDFLSKFMILVRLLASMSTEQLNQMTISIEIAKNSNKVNKNLMRIIYRDAIAQAGTGGAFHEIKSWILSKYVQGEEAAEIVTALANSVHYPTNEIITEFFTFAMSPEVTEQKFLNSSVLLAAVKLARLSKDKEFVEGTVIPRLSKELKNAVKNGDSGKAQTYVRTIGNLADPGILKVYAPYLEGHVAVSKYLRTQMILNLKALANAKNEEVRAILYVILKNTAEPYEIRVAAALNIFMAHPTAEIMQTMAWMTTNDPSTQVRAVLQKSITHAAKLKDPRFAELAKIAQSVIHMIPEENFGRGYSTNSMSDGLKYDDEFGIFREFSLIGSKDNILPKYLSSTISSNNSGWTDKNQITLSMSSVQQLMDSIEQVYYNNPAETNNNFTYSAETIANILNIKPETRQPFEGALFTDNLGQERFFTFIETEIKSLVTGIMSYMNELIRGVKVSYTKVLSQKQVYVEFPIAMGMPFIFEYSEPIVLSFEGKATIKLFSGNFNGHIKFTYARNLDGRVGFIDTLSDVVVSTGVINKLQLYVPIFLQVIKKRGVQKLILRTDWKRDYNATHFSVWPYTTLQKRGSLLTVFEESATKLIERPKKVISTDLKFGQQTGIVFQLEGYSYSSDYKNLLGLFEHDVVNGFSTLLNQKDIASTQFNLKYLPRLSKNKDVSVMMDEKTYIQNGNTKTTDFTENVASVSKVHSYLMKQVASDNYTKLKVVDITFALGDRQNVEYMRFSTIGINYISHEFETAIIFCGTEDINVVFKTTRPNIVALKFEDAVKDEIKVTYGADIKFKDLSIHMKAIGKRTDNYTEMLLQDSKAKQCKLDTAQNNSYQEDCYKIILKAHTPDLFKGSVTYNANTSALPVLPSYVYDLILKQLLPFEKEINPQKTAEKGTMEFEIQAFHYDKYISSEITTEFGTLLLKTVEEAYYNYAKTIFTPVSLQRSRNWFSGYQNLPYCAVDGSKVSTFSGRSYDYTLTSSWHVVMVDFAKKTDLVIMARRPNENQLQVYVSYKTDTGNTLELQITPTNVDIKSNVKEVSNGPLTLYWDDKRNVALLDYYKATDDDNQVFILNNGKLRLVYDKQRLVIFTEEHRDTRGICGQNSGDIRDDYITPFGLVDVPEYYGALFSIEDDVSDQKTVELKKEAKLKAYQPVMRYTSIPYSDKLCIKVGPGELWRASEVHFSIQPSHGETEDWIMKLLVLAAFIAVASSGRLSEQQPDNQQQWPWQAGKQYRYEVNSHTLARLHEGSSSGNAFKAQFIVRVKSSGRLQAKLENPQHALVHQQLPNNMALPSDLQYKSAQNLDKPFEISVEGGRVLSISLPSSISVANENLLKGLISTLQVDLSNYRHVHSPQDNYDKERQQGLFKKIETDVTGDCETLYSVSPVAAEWRRELPRFASENDPMEITKSKNYGHCHHRVAYHFGVPEGAEWTGTAHKNSEKQFITHSAVSRILAGKQGPIYKAETTSSVHVHPHVYGKQKAEVHSYVQLNLLSVEEDNGAEWQKPEGSRQIKTLLYSMSTKQMAIHDQSSSSSFSSEESHEHIRVQAEDRQNENGYFNKQASDEERQNRANSQQSYQSSSSSDSSSAYINDDTPKMNEPAYAALYLNTQSRGDNKQNPMNAQKLLLDLAQQLQNPNNMPKADFLTKFNILVRVIASMSANQLAQTSRGIEVGKTSNNILKADMWMIFRDAVVQAGTPPAFQQIKTWIMSQKIQNEEAAQVIASLANTLRYPTKEIMIQFFELAMNPVVQQQQSLNVSALIAATKFIRMGQVDNATAQSYYPTQMYGRLARQHDRFVVDNILPRLAQKLREAVQNEERSKAQVYIKAIGNLGHREILQVFAPYLEGRTQVSTYLRVQMVSQLKSLVDQKDKYARAVLYSILRNTAEPYEVRVAAILNMFRANPSADMMQVMAQMTNDDPSIQVRAALKSGIETAATLKDPRYWHLARSAQAVKEILTPENFGAHYSISVFSDGYDNSEEVNNYRQTSYIGGDDGAVPKQHRLTWRNRIAGWASENSANFAFSSAQELVDYIKQMIAEPRKSNANQKYSANRISEMLNIKREQQNPLEGAFGFEIFDQERFFAFDESDLKKLVQDVMEYMEQMEKGVEKHYTKVFNAKQVSVMFPIASGVPFIYKYKEPVVIHIQSKASGKIDNDKKNPKNIHATMNKEVQLTFARNIDGNVGFMDTLGNQHASAGVVKKYQINVPAKLSMQMKSGEYQMRVEPLNPGQDTTIAHFSVWPYSANHKKDSLTPNSQDKTSQIVKRPQMVSSTDVKFGQQTGTIFHLQGYSHSKSYKNANNLASALYNMGELLAPQDIALTHYNIRYLGKQSKSKAVTFTAVYDEFYNQKQGGELGQASQTNDAAPNSGARREEMVKRVSSGINTARAQVVDLSATFEGPQQQQYVMTAALAKSQVDRKVQAALFLGRNSAQNANEQINAVAKVVMPETSPLNLLQALKKDMQMTYEADVKYGQNGHIHIVGNAQRSQQYTEQLKENALTKQCEQEIAEGNQFQPSCFRMIVKAHAPDNFKASVTYQNVNAVSMNMTTQAYRILQQLSGNIEANPMKKVGNGKLELEAQASYIDNTLRFEMTSSNGLVRLYNVPIPQFAPYVMSTYTPSGSSNAWERVGNYETYNQYLPHCTVDGKKVKTFSNRTYDYKLSGAWHLVMQQEEAKKQGKWDELVILARRPNEQEQEIYISHKTPSGKDLEIEIPASAAQNKANVKVQSNAMKISDGDLTIYWDEAAEEPLLQYSTHPDGVLMLNIRDGRLRALFDGQRFVVATKEYRRTTRGICGRNSAEPRDDYQTPYGLVDQPELYGASFALDGENSDSQTQELKKQAQQQAYQPETKYTAILRSDEEWQQAQERNNENWGSQNVYRTRSYKKQRGQCQLQQQVQYRENHGEICITTTPLPACQSHCRGEDYRIQAAQVICSSKSDQQFKTYKKQIQQGQNPQVSGVPKVEQYRVPSSCRA